MTGMPCRCASCGLTFVSETITIEGLAPNTHISNVGISCPRCHQLARAIEGKFDFVDSKIKPIYTDPRSLDILEFLNLLLRESTDGISPDEILRKIEEYSPELAKEARSTVNKGGIPALILLLLLLIKNCQTTASINVNVNLNELVDQARVYVTKSQPYPIRENVDAPEQKAEPESMSQQKQGTNRQQRRLQERQSKKQQTRSSLRLPRAPKKKN
jgi:hypothetical protein